LTPENKKSFWALMVTQFAGAFNDNLFKVLITLLILQWIPNVGQQEQLVSLTGAVFVAPFLIFSMVAGRVADRYSKPKVTLATKIWELFVIIIAVMSLWLRSFPVMLTTLFVLAMQSAFFSPAKYGVLPELMGESEISKANAWLNIGTFAAILFGTIAATLTSTNIVGASLTLVAFGLLGVWASLRMNPLPAAKPKEPLAWNPFRDLAANLKLMRPDRDLWLSALFVNYFWFLGALLQLNIFLYANQMMQASPKLSGILLVPVILGIGIGSYLAGRLSKGHIELGLVPWGAMGMAIFSSDLVWAYDNVVRVMIDLFMLGFSAGFYEIPLIALIQWRAPHGERGRILATINFMSFAAILASSIFLWLLNTPLKLSPAQVFGALGLLSLLSTSLLCWTFPEARRRALGLLPFRRSR
jgi:acyl-[acyl-carrier-protein]-phospholipid O-acyltransferase / long-chain-fatty-acid--[acyl-carrier-protein] ligase